MQERNLITFAFYKGYSSLREEKGLEAARVEDGGPVGRSLGSSRRDTMVHRTWESGSAAEGAKAQATLVWLPAGESSIQANLRDIRVSLPDHCSKVNHNLFAGCGRGSCLQFVKSTVSEVQ